MRASYCSTVIGGCVWREGREGGGTVCVERWGGEGRGYTCEGRGLATMTHELAASLQVTLKID